MNKSPRYFSDL